ncbi:MAG TPA: hypothetical protein VMN36_13850 [Verrucomicrobiales bacterium]|nr:hypothetical protein [Verrucomicrobiales bacterium]
MSSCLRSACPGLGQGVLTQLGALGCARRCRRCAPPIEQTPVATAVLLGVAILVLIVRDLPQFQRDFSVLRPRHSPAGETLAHLQQRLVPGGDGEKQLPILVHADSEPAFSMPSKPQSNGLKLYFLCQTLQLSVDIWARRVQCQADGDAGRLAEIAGPVRERLFELSRFMQEFKHKFSLTVQLLHNVSDTK